MENEWSPEEEARRLEARFVELKQKKISQAKFARDFQVPGGPSMVNQHIKAHRPMNLAAATAYAKGFGCSLAEISPRLAKEVSLANDSPAREYSQPVSEPLQLNNNEGSAASLLLRLTGILESLTQGQRGAAAELIAEAIKSPRLASSNAALLEAMASGNAHVATAVRSEHDALAELHKTRKPFPDDDIDTAYRRRAGD